MVTVAVQGLSLIRNNRPILHNIHFTLNQSCVLAIIGPSGAGKSSLLRCFNRLEEPSAGEIHLNDKPISSLSIIELRRHVGMIFQKTAVFDGTVLDNVQFGPQLVDTPLSQEKVQRLLQLASLEESLLHRNAHELSGGQEQRLAIARALANEPEILLLDEPTSALDPVATQQVESALLHLKDELGLTLIWVTHSIEQAHRVADYVLFLDDGEQIAMDRADVILDAQTGDARVLRFVAGETDNDKEA